jgi:hypothetical protein
VTAGGITSNIDPEAWRIVEGKLYMSYDKPFAAEFAAHPGDYLAKAEADWPSINGAVPDRLASVFVERVPPQRALITSRASLLTGDHA